MGSVRRSLTLEEHVVVLELPDVESELDDEDTLRHLRLLGFADRAEGRWLSGIMQTARS